MNMEKLEKMIDEAFVKERLEQETMINKELSGGD